MSKEDNFRKELAELMLKHNTVFEIEIESDYAGVQYAKLVFHIREGVFTDYSTDNMLHSFDARGVEITSRDILQTLNKE